MAEWGFKQCCACISWGCGFLSKEIRSVFLDNKLIARFVAYFTLLGQTNFHVAFLFIKIESRTFFWISQTELLHARYHSNEHVTIVPLNMSLIFMLLVATLDLAGIFFNIRMLRSCLKDKTKNKFLQKSCSLTVFCVLAKLRFLSRMPCSRGNS